MTHHKRYEEPEEYYQEDEDEFLDDYSTEEDHDDIPEDDYEAEWEKEYNQYCDWLENSGRPAGDR